MTSRWTLLLLSVLYLAPSVPTLAGTTLQAIHDAGRISIGYRQVSAPFSSEDANGAPEGYSIELCLYIVEAVRAELGLPELEIEWIPVTPQTRLPSIVYGRVELECGSTTNTLSRQRLVDFSYTTYVTGTRLLVRKGEGLNSFKDLVGKSLAMIPDTTTERTMLQARAQTGVSVDMLKVNDHDKGLAALSAGEIDAYASDDILQYGLIASSDDPEGFEVVDGFLSYEPYALVIPRTDPDFRHLVNSTLARLFRNGQI